MGFFDYFFSNKTKKQEIQIQFGRFSDAYKDEEKYDAWDESLIHFEQDRYIEAYKSFFSYLLDETVGNVSVEEGDKQLKFTLFQGSKVITGVATNERFQAEAKIARTNNLHIGFMRRLLEENFQLKYCRYALDKEDNITMVFGTDAIDGSPYKLYHSLKELSTRADKKDDLLLHEFESLEPINNRHIREIQNEEKRIKYDFCQTLIKRTLDVIENTKLNLNQYPGAESYLYLDLIYQMDYLVKPEGNIMEVIDRIHNLYFHDKMKPHDHKNRLMRVEIKKIKEIGFDEFCEEIYEVKSTFGITQPSGMHRIQEFINSEVKNMDWYYQEGYEDVALSIPSYIVGYSLFNYSMPAPLRDLFNLYYQVIKGDYFNQLGISMDLTRNGKINGSSVKKMVKNIIKKHHDNYPKVEADFKGLLVDNNCLFAKTYLLMIKKMDFQRSDNR